MQKVSTSAGEPAHDSDAMVLVADAPGPRDRTSPADRWKILVVDDDPDVHAATRFALAQTSILERGLDLIEANSVSDAQGQLLQHPDTAVILLDVVMETHDAGLRFARWVREAGLDEVRIILRTGQPGYAPELEVVGRYDVNDYRAKSQLTQIQLVSSLTGALRAYKQLRDAARPSEGMEAIISSCARLFHVRDLRPYAQSVLLQAASLCEVSGDGLLCVARHPDELSSAVVIAGAGDYAGRVGQPLSDLPAGDDLRNAIASGAGGHPPPRGAFLQAIELSPECSLIIAFRHPEQIDAQMAALVALYLTSVRIGFEAAGLLDRARTEAALAA